MVGIAEGSMNGKGYLEVPRWKGRPDFLEFEFAAGQCEEREIRGGVSHGLIVLNLKVTPYQLGRLRKYTIDRLWVRKPDGSVEAIDDFKWGIGKFCLEPGHWGYEIFIESSPLPGPDSVVTLRLIPRESGGELK